VSYCTRTWTCVSFFVVVIKIALMAVCCMFKVTAMQLSPLTYLLREFAYISRRPVCRYIASQNIC